MTDCPRVGDVRLLWHVDYWDGPLRGLAQHNGRDYWFALEEVEDPDDPPPEWRFFLYPLTDEELEVEHEEHRRYQKYFGRHDDYDANGVHTVDDMSWEAKQPPFWERKKKFRAEAPMRESPDYESRPPIAWFTWKRAYGGTYLPEAIVLVWNKNPPPPLIHRDESCPSLARSVIPGRNSPYWGGKGTAGWLPVAEAQRVPEARLCGRCMS